MNEVSFGLGMLYLAGKYVYTYGSIPPEFVSSVGISWFYFMMTSKIQYSKLKALYRLVFENNKLVKEMKRLLDIFPEGVIIKSRPDDASEKVLFQNQEFRRRMAETEKFIEDLDKFKVKYKESEENELREVTTTLK